MNIPAGAINPTHAVTSGFGCPDTTTSVTGVSPGAPVYTITIRGTAGPDGDNLVVTSISVTISWTNP